MHPGFRVWQQWAAGTFHDDDNDDGDNGNVTERSATLTDGEGRQPDGRKPVHAGSHSAWGTECPAGSASRHQRCSIGIAGSQLFTTVVAWA